MRIEYSGAEKKYIEADTSEEAIQRYIEQTSDDKCYQGVVATESATFEEDSPYPNTIYLVKGITIEGIE